MNLEGKVVLINERSKKLLDIQESAIRKKFNNGYSVKNKNNKGNVNYANRGMNFEKLIENTNHYYMVYEKSAYIRKIPTPIKVLGINDKGRIIDGFYEKKSSLDFNGVLDNGRHIDFDTKETKSKTSFPLYTNVSEHQLEYMKEIFILGGVTFLLVNFKEYNETYLIDYEDILNYTLEFKEKKSIPYLYFKERLKDNLCEKTYKNGIYICDYLKVVEKLL